MGKVNAKIVLEYAFVQITANNILEFLEENFGEVEIIESLQSFFKFKIYKDG